MEKKTFWIKLKNSEFSVLVECLESDFEKTGLIRCQRVNKDGSKEFYMFSANEIVSVSEEQTKKEEE